MSWFPNVPSKCNLRRYIPATGGVFSSLGAAGFVAVQVVAVTAAAVGLHSLTGVKSVPRTIY
jgi:hypothetical protein